MGFRAWVDVAEQYSLGPVLCNFNEGFAVFATFRQLASARVFPGRTSIRPQLDNVFAQRLTMHSD